ncbi:MAG: thioredoxin family protein, partial [Candidatus Marinimicrobia bacterium]|nr:thioredoxin family protein [Candidatus Neomarinimicrobiota bacterium]
DEKSQLAKAFGATRTPHIYLFDSEGTLVYRGAIDDNSKNAKKVKKTYLADAMNAILAGEPIAPASTKAFGCTIKFAKN